jgi:hypothetical protein
MRFPARGRHKKTCRRERTGSREPGTEDCWLAGTGTAPAAPPFIRFLVIDMEALLQLEHGLIDANAALRQWAHDRGLEFDVRDTPEGSAWASRIEEYITDPSGEPDPGKRETDVAYLLRG